MDTLTTTDRPEGRRQHRSRVEQAILAATQGLLQDRPASEVTIADIMDAVGLSRTAFYRYFPDVNAVLVRLLQEVRSRFVTYWLEAPDDADFTAVLDSDARASLVQFEAHAAIIRACLDARTSAPELYVAWLQNVEEIVQQTSSRIEDLNRHGVTKVDRPGETARALITFTIYYAVEGLARVGDDDDDGRRALAETLMAVWYRTLFATL
ncbi:MAG TPA: TetR/AcrR family transcriptional regulator [Acidimicrobiales bacterium]|nr:TetR/AcrR family transcriptional regulator [Acidimicrobiales bacterium]